MSQPRRILLVVHPSRPEVHDHALGVVRRLNAAGVTVAVLGDEMRGTPLEGHPDLLGANPEDPTHGCELVCILGGDGSILRNGRERGGDLGQRQAYRLSGADDGETTQHVAGIGTPVPARAVRRDQPPRFVEP